MGLFLQTLLALLRLLPKKLCFGGRGCGLALQLNGTQGLMLDALLHLLKQRFTLGGDELKLHLSIFCELGQLARLVGCGLGLGEPNIGQLGLVPEGPGATFELSVLCAGLGLAPQKERLQFFLDLVQLRQQQVVLARKRRGLKPLLRRSLCLFHCTFPGLFQQRAAFGGQRAVLHG